MTTDRRAFMRHLGAGAFALQLGDVFAEREVIEAEIARSARLAWDELGAAYSLDPRVTYFNHASIGTIPKPVQRARRRYLATCESNPWLYMWGDAWETAREQVRTRAADYLGVDADSVALNHNTTEAFNLLAAGLELGAADEVLFNSMNHPGASICFEHHASKRGYRVRRFDLPLQRVPELSEEELVDLYSEQIRDETKLLVLPHVDNTVGVRLPLAKIAAAARRRGVEWVAVDGAQAIGMLDVAVASLGVDVYATSPHKWLQAPKGLGLLWMNEAARARVHPQWVTWGQKRWAGSVRVFEDYGTRNVAEVLTLGDAIAFQQQLGRARKEARLHEIWRHLRTRVDDAGFLRWHSPRDWSVGASLVAVEVIGRRSAEVFERMYGRHGFVFRAFSQPGLETMRISPNVFQRKADIDRFVAVLGREFA